MSSCCFCCIILWLYAMCVIVVINCQTNIFYWEWEESIPLKKALSTATQTIATQSNAPPPPLLVPQNPPRLPLPHNHHLTIIHLCLNNFHFQHLLFEIIVHLYIHTDIPFEDYFAQQADEIDDVVDLPQLGINGVQRRQNKSYN